MTGGALTVILLNGFFQSDEGILKRLQTSVTVLGTATFLSRNVIRSLAGFRLRCSCSIAFQHYQPLPSPEENHQPDLLVDETPRKIQMFQVRLFVRLTAKGCKAQSVLQHPVVHGFIHPWN